MRLLELCLASVLAPQEAPSSPPPVPATVGVPAAAEPATPAMGRASASDQATELATIALGPDAGAAARAAWTLGSSKDDLVLPSLHEVAQKSPHADARAHAMQAMLRFQHVSSTATAIAGLHDADRTVRTFAAQLLGKLARPAALLPLLAMFDDARRRDDAGPATDLQAGLLALCDLGAGDRLLQVATAIHDSRAEGTGEALAWCCQTLAPKLPHDQQVTLALALLGHRELLVRRWAIGRTAELDEPTAQGALEARLRSEGKELLPLVELALAQVRKDDRAKPLGELERARQNAAALWVEAMAFWRRLTPYEQLLFGSAPLALLALLLLVRRRRRAAAAEAAATTTIALVQPSDGFVDRHGASDAWAHAQALDAPTDEAAAEDLLLAATEPPQEFVADAEPLQESLDDAEQLGESQDVAARG